MTEYSEDTQQQDPEDKTQYIFQSDEKQEWITFSFTVIAAVIAILYFFIPLLLSQFMKAPVAGHTITDQDMIYSLLFSQGPIIVILVLLAIAFKRTISIKEKFAFTNWNWSFTTFPFFIELLLLPAIWLVTVIFQLVTTFFFDLTLPPRDLQVFLMGCSEQTLIIMAIGAVIIAPIIEELMFRKIIFDFVEKNTSQLIAIVVTSALFAAVHFTLIQSPALFLIAVVLQLLYIKYKSIYPAIIMHMVHNGTTFLILIALRYMMKNDFLRAIIEQNM